MLHHPLFKDPNSFKATPPFPILSMSSQSPTIFQWPHLNLQSAHWCLFLLYICIEIVAVFLDNNNFPNPQCQKLFLLQLVCRSMFIWEAHILERSDPTQAPKESEDKGNSGRWSPYPEWLAKWVGVTRPNKEMIIRSTPLCVLAPGALQSLLPTITLPSLTYFFSPWEKILNSLGKCEF